jgi:hypothetical protein
LKRFFKTYYLAAAPLIGGTVGFLLTDHRFIWWTWAIQACVFVLMIFLCRWQRKQNDRIEEILSGIRKSRSARWN